jgi:hypothetical protein
MIEKMEGRPQLKERIENFPRFSKDLPMSRSTNVEGTVKEGDLRPI